MKKIKNMMILIGAKKKKKRINAKKMKNMMNVNVIKKMKNMMILIGVKKKINAKKLANINPY